jgi:hypothetical protein
LPSTTNVRSKAKPPDPEPVLAPVTKLLVEELARLLGR